MNRKIFLLLLLFALGLNSAQAATFWQTQTSGTSAEINGLYFFDQMTGLAVGSDQLIIKTSNSGVSWASKSPSGLTFSMNAVHCPSAGVGYAAGSSGSDGLILKTTDSGENWSSLTSFPNADRITDIFFISDDTGWVTCDTTAGSFIPVYKTTDGGSTWNSCVVGLDTTADFKSVQFISADTGWVAGENGLIYRTTNGGTNWSQQAAGLTGSTLNDLNFIDQNNGWAVGAGGVIMATTNSGTNWTLQTSGTGSDLQAVAFYDAGNGVAAGSSGTLLSTTNAGLNWSATNETTQAINSVFFSDQYNGWAAGAAGTSLKRVTDPTISAGPASKYQGYDSSFTLNGTNFLPSATVTVSAASVSGGADSISTSWVSAAQLIVNLHLSLTATTGAWDLRLINGDGGLASTTFTVIERYSGGGGGSSTPKRDVVALPSPNKNITPANPAVIQLTPQNGFSGPVTIHLMSITGQIKKTLQTSLTRDAVTKILYDGTDLFDHLVAPGVYRIQINAEGRTVGTGMLTVAR
ncbi:MAG: hypothetical protein JW782_02170 [Candidatus Saganbacteria bacterium]|nr:hypothetical protein [Candidatus Saganbacteria bacterium]